MPWPLKVWLTAAPRASRTYPSACPPCRSGRAAEPARAALARGGCRPLDRRTRSPRSDRGGASQGTFLRMGPKEGRTKADDLGVEQEPVATRPEAGVAEYSPDGVYLALATKDTVEIVKSQRWAALCARARPSLATLTRCTSSGDTVCELSRHRVVAVAWSPCSRFFVTWERPSETGSPPRPSLRLRCGAAPPASSPVRRPRAVAPRTAAVAASMQRISTSGASTPGAGSPVSSSERSSARCGPSPSPRTPRPPPHPRPPRRTGHPSSSRRMAACLATR